jgi:hypothetical protein
MVKKSIALNGSLHNRMVESRIRKRIWEQCKQVFLLFSSVSSDGKLGLLRLVVVVFDFRYANNYTIASNMSLLKIRSIRGWC